MNINEKQSFAIVLFADDLINVWLSMRMNYGEYFLCELFIVIF